MPNPAVLLIEGSDFETFPAGGQLTMARSLMKIFGNRLALVGMAGDRSRPGQWSERIIGGVTYRFFTASLREPSAKRPFIPARLRFYAGLRRYRERILSLGCRAAFLQAPEALLAVSEWRWDSLCFWFAGVENPLRISRYPFARPLSGLFDKSLFSALEKVDVVMAAADKQAIHDLVARGHGKLDEDRVVQVPTCVDTTEFRPMPRNEARAAIGINTNGPVFATSGRISRFKGWELLLDSFAVFLERRGEGALLFVGDGEDRTPLEQAIQARGLAAKVKVTGFQKPREVAAHLNAADVIVFGSFVEGWSAAMLEALACGKPVVSTAVSAVSSMVANGRNGFVVENRDPIEFAAAMERALSLDGAGQVSESIAAEYALPRFGERLGSLWPPFAAHAQVR